VDDDSRQRRPSPPSFTCDEAGFPAEEEATLPSHRDAFQKERDDVNAFDDDDDEETRELTVVFYCTIGYRSGMEATRWVRRQRLRQQKSQRNSRLIDDDDDDDNSECSGGGISSEQQQGKNGESALLVQGRRRQRPSRQVLRVYNLDGIVAFSHAAQEAAAEATSSGRSVARGVIVPGDACDASDGRLVAAPGGPLVAASTTTDDAKQQRCGATTTRIHTFGRQWDLIPVLSCCHVNDEQPRDRIQFESTYFSGGEWICRMAQVGGKTTLYALEGVWVKATLLCATISSRPCCRGRRRLEGD